VAPRAHLPVLPALLLFLSAGCAAGRLANQGDRLLADDRPGEASRCYRQACERKPHKAEFQLGYARALLADDRPAPAVEPARLAVEAGEEGAEVLLVDALLRLGRADEARTIIQRALRSDEDDPDFLELQARDHLVRGDELEAVDAMRKALEAGPSATRRATLAWVLARAARMPQAVEAAERALQEDPTDPAVLADAAAVFLLAEREQERADVVVEIQTYVIGPLEMFKERASRREDAGDREGALRAMAQAVACSPEDGDLLGLLGGMYLALEEPVQAIHFIDMALHSQRFRTAWLAVTSDSSGSGVHTMAFRSKEVAAYARMLAAAHAMKGDSRRAAQTLEAAMVLAESADPDGWVELALLYFDDVHDPQAAARAAQNALDLDRRHLGALLLLGRLHQSVGDLDQAVGYGRMAWQSAPGEPRVALALGLYYEQRGDPTSAREVYRLSLQQNPDNAALKAALRGLGR